MRLGRRLLGEAGGQFLNTFREELFMLCIGRRVGEKLVLGEDIVVTVLRSTNGQCRLGIEAPRELNIARAELVEREIERNENQ